MNKIANKKFIQTQNRIIKAKKIEAVLLDYLEEEINGLKILDIGTGNGEIADFFAKRNQVFSVDLLDQRKNKKSRVRFRKVNSEELPFKSKFFDIVISNHTIEHTPNQEKHLSEIKRVLRNGGIAYLATPNRFFPYEVHYKVWFIHYLPNNKFYKILKKREVYQEDLFLLNYYQMKKIFSKYFKVKEYTSIILSNPEKYFLKIPIIDKLPLWFNKILNPFSQTNVFILKK